MAIFGLFLPVALARFFVLDVIGGFFLILSSCIGWYAVRGGMDITWLLCLAVILFLNSVFDAFILIARLLHVTQPMFGNKVSVQVNIVHGVLFMGPVVELVGASICWIIYKEHVANMFSEERDIMDMEQAGYGAAPAGVRTSAMPPRRNAAGSSASTTGPREKGFEAFKGTGRKLED